MAKVVVEMDIVDCRDCLFKRSHSGHGECWTYCSKKGGEPYSEILWGCQEQFKSIPEWCPLGLG